MYVEDQDEDVEEEEEFHEVEEEKHKTSRESVGESCNDTKTPEKVAIANSTDNGIDWADIMLNSKASTSNDLVAENSSGDKEQSIDIEETQSIASAAADDTIDGIIKLTNDKLKIDDENSSSSETVQATDLESTPAHIESSSSVVESSSAIVESSPAVVEPSPAVEESSPAVKESSPAVVESSPAAEESSPAAVESSPAAVEPTLAAVEPTLASGESAPAGVETTLADVEPTRDSRCEQEQDLDEVSKEGEALDVVEISDQCEPSQSADDCKIEPVNEVEKKELDLDEDVKNPQYIPKKGMFYEHDDRSHDVEDKKSSTESSKKEDDAVEVKENSANKKPTGSEKQIENRRSNRRQRTDGDRWGHDLFRNEKQKPKSKSELINAYGYDIRQEKSARNQTDNRASRTNNTGDRPPANQDNQRARQARDVKAPRQNQTTANRSRERRPRRQNSRGNRGENSQTTVNRREAPINRSSKLDNTKDLRETLNEKHAAQEAAAAAAALRRDQEAPNLTRNSRNDSRSRRRTSRDRPSNDESRLPPANTVMPPITTWSSEDMMKAEAFVKKSPPRVQPQSSATTNSITSTAPRDRSTDFWQQNQPNKNVYPDRSTRNQDEIRHQPHYNSRSRYQERGDDNYRATQFVPRSQFNDRSNQHHEWNRAGNFSSYAKPNDYIVKTQTFENSRLSQGSVNRANNNRDLREAISDRRVHGQQNFHNKVQHPVDHHMNHRGPAHGHYHHQYAQPHHYMHQHQQPIVQNQQHLQQTQSPQQSVSQNQQHQQSQQQSQRPQQQSPQQTQETSNVNLQQQQQQPNSQTQQQRQPPTTQAAQPQPHPTQPRQNLTIDNLADSGQDSARLNATNNNDLINSRPIIKTDTYNGGVMSTHTQPLPQHPQNHRSMGGPMAQQGTGAANSHLVPSHLGAGITQPQYYAPSTSSRDPAAATLATAYHGYLPSGHSMMDPSRYHMTSQQLSDHGYITSAGQTNDVAAGSVLHQQGLYTDTSAGGTLANTAYIAPTGSTLSPTTNIPVTGAGPQSLPPGPYIQHSQYPPPPYSNPYSQPQHNQAPPQSGHAYPPYWTYI